MLLAPAPEAAVVPASTPNLALLQAVGPSLVRVFRANLQGSGVVVYRTGEVLTALAVAGGPDDYPTVMDASGRSCRAVQIGADLDELTRLQFGVRARTCGQMSCFDDLAEIVKLACKAEDARLRYYKAGAGALDEAHELESKLLRARADKAGEALHERYGRPECD
ncbi:MAG: serine protease [Chloroflexi bacterium]|nr:serine protease [Chloroflexota bacterium]